MFPFRSPASAALSAILLCLPWLTPSAHAADAAADEAARGRTIAGAVCAPCHGADGNAGKRAYPPLAGQPVSYLLSQLEQFRSGSRPELEMSDLTARLSPSDLRAVAYYLSTQTPKAAGAAAPVAAAGQSLFASGRPAEGLPACQACHGARGEGLAAAGLPRLAGQPALYVMEQLQAFRARERGAEAGNPMHEVAAHLSDVDMRALASYVQGLH